MKKWNTDDIYWKVQEDGLGYTIQHYLSGYEIKNESLAEKWDQCSKLLSEIDRILESSVDEE
jgi:hypothetical protein